MSLNYYLRTSAGDHHLGLSTMGLEFLFAAQPGLASFADVRRALETGVILDEADRVVSAEEFLATVRAGDSGRKLPIYGCPDRYRDDEGHLFCRYEFC